MSDRLSEGKKDYLISKGCEYERIITDDAVFIHHTSSEVIETPWGTVVNSGPILIAKVVELDPEFDWQFHDTPTFQCECGLNWEQE